MVETFFNLFIYLLSNVVKNNFFQQFFIVGSVFGIVKNIWWRIVNL